MEIAAQAQGVVVLEATLLVEAGYGPGFDLIVTVEAPCELRLERAIARGMNPESRPRPPPRPGGRRGAPRARPTG